MDVCNSLAYEGRLECGSAEVSQATLSLPRADLLASLLPRDCWLLEALSPALGRSVVFVCTDGLGWAPERAPSCNQREAGLSALVLAALLKVGTEHGRSSKTFVFALFITLCVARLEFFKICLFYRGFVIIKLAFTLDKPCFTTVTSSMFFVVRNIYDKFNCIRGLQNIGT